ncbi:MAG TPA: TlpA disulfide reductase family protein [Bryobacteraceae bacterium]|nr:TlpA disulfide reductase family protein [Bryobacteraceae bacterium]
MSDTDRMIAERLSSCRPEADWNPDVQRGLVLLRERRVAVRSRRRPWFVAAGAMAVCLPIMALPMTQAFAKRCVSACVEETASVRALLLGTAPSSTYINAAERKTAPDFTLSDASGASLKLSGFRGKVVLLNFWATWCSPCEREIPWFVQLQQRYEGRGFSVLGVSMDQGGWNAVKPYVAKKLVNYPVVMGNEQTAALFGGLESIPLTLVIDRSGRIAAIHLGLCTRAEYENDIAAVLNE